MAHPQLLGSVFNRRPPRAKIGAFVDPELHLELKLQAVRNGESISDLLVRLITAAPAAAWNRPEGNNQ